jgi:hypothetical protein
VACGSVVSVTMTGLSGLYVHGGIDGVRTGLGLPLLPFSFS